MLPLFTELKVTEEKEEDDVQRMHINFNPSSLQWVASEFSRNFFPLIGIKRTFSQINSQLTDDGLLAGCLWLVYRLTISVTTSGILKFILFLFSAIGIESDYFPLSWWR